MRTLSTMIVTLASGVVLGGCEASREVTVDAVVPSQCSAPPVAEAVWITPAAWHSDTPIIQQVIGNERFRELLDGSG